MALSSAEKRTESTAIERSSSIARRGLLAVVGVVLANALLRVASVTLAPTLAGVEPFGWGPIVAASAVATIVATGVYWGFDRFTERPSRNFTVLAGVVLVVSLAPLVTVAPAIPGMTTGGLVALGAMHIASAVVIVGALAGAVGR